MLWMWREGTQEVGVSKHEEKKVRESGTAVESMEEDKRAQWSEGAASKRSGNVYGRMDNKKEGGNLCGVLGM